MKIILENIGRRFNREWIFRSISYTFQSGESYAILGPNGSGKSTLLQLISGSLTPSAGTINYISDTEPIDGETIYRYLAFASPYMELIEEFTLNELINFHFKFKPYLPGLNAAAVTELLAFSSSGSKLIKYFSSGMKQRTKLALAFCSDAPVLLLDEPASNLDEQGISWYAGLVKQYCHNRIVIVCSNQEHEYRFCGHRLNIPDYKI